MLNSLTTSSLVDNTPSVTLSTSFNNLMSFFYKLEISNLHHDLAIRTCMHCRHVASRITVNYMHLFTGTATLSG